MSEEGMVEEAVNAFVPLPFTYPDNEFAPVPPLATDKVGVVVKTPFALDVTIPSVDKAGITTVPLMVVRVVEAEAGPPIVRVLFAPDRPEPMFSIVLDPDNPPVPNCINLVNVLEVAADMIRCVKSKTEELPILGATKLPETVKAAL
jgi:hypothetical protein